jgi:SET domain-containing protein
LKTQNYPQNNQIESPETDYLYYEASQIENAGNGLFTAIDIYEGEVISLFKGEIISDQEAAKRVELKQDQYFINLLDGSIMDSKQTHCFAKYANDAEGITGGPFKNNAKITLDDDDNVCIVATTDISIGEEIFCGYGKSYWEKHG